MAHCDDHVETDDLFDPSDDQLDPVDDPLDDLFDPSDTLRDDTLVNFLNLNEVTANGEPVIQGTGDATATGGYTPAAFTGLTSEQMQQQSTALVGFFSRLQVDPANGTIYDEQGVPVATDLSAQELVNVYNAYNASPAAASDPSVLSRVWNVIRGIASSASDFATRHSGIANAAIMLGLGGIGLAPLVIREIFRALAALKAEGLTILLVEQNARAAFRIADRGYILSPGGLLAPVEANGHGAESTYEAYGLALGRGERAS